ncbi:MAG: signal peptide peptidase SppA [Verrucomicrobiota bacterium]
MSSRRKGCVTALIVIGALFVLLIIASLIGGALVGDSVSQEKYQEITLLEGSGGKIARIDVEGVISSEVDRAGQSMVSRFKEQVTQALSDKEVKAIVLHVNSPGGGVTASDTMYQAVAEARQKKPVVVYMNSVAASGGYYIACAANQIVANETTITGSIGVIIQTFGFQGLLNSIGLELRTFKSGQNKDLLNGARDLTEEEKAIVQNLVNESYDKFVSIVAEGRGIEPATLREGIADGRIFSGRQAFQNKLVDQLGYVETAYQVARELGKAPEAEVIRYQESFGLGALLSLLGKAPAMESENKIEIDVAERLLPNLQPGQMYFLPAYYLR